MNIPNTESFSDHVAKLLYETHVRVSEETGEPIKNIYNKTKQIIRNPYPIQSLEFTYRLSVGDVLQPVEDIMVPFTTGPLVLLTTDRFVVYQLSYPEQSVDISTRPESKEDIKKLSYMIFMYEANTSGEFSLYDIKRMIFGHVFEPITPILAVCKTVGNVANQF